MAILRIDGCATSSCPWPRACRPAVIHCAIALIRLRAWFDKDNASSLKGAAHLCTDEPVAEFVGSDSVAAAAREPRQTENSCGLISDAVLAFPLGCLSLERCGASASPPTAACANPTLYKNPTENGIKKARKIALLLLKNYLYKMNYLCIVIW
jgi:hypothetical protein